MSRFNELICLVREVDHSTGVVKKKNVDQLKEILNDDGTIAILYKNSGSNASDRLNWNGLFSSVHCALLKVEENRRRKATSAADNLSSNCSSLLTSIVKKACGEYPGIKSTTLVRSFLEVMSSDYLKQNIGITYVDILKIALLSKRKYRSDVTHELWRELFMVTIKLYRVPPARVEHSLIVEIMNIIVMYGSCQSDLCNLTRDLFSEIKTTFHNSQFCRSKYLHQERLIQLSVTLCSQTAQECRSALCKFGEDIICPLICMYDKFSVKGKILLHDLLLLQLHAHHPDGEIKESLCSYAFNWGKWDVCLTSMYNLILAEIDQPVDKKNKHISPSFLSLGVEVCKQVFFSSDLEVNGDEDLEGSTSKRRKLDVGIMSLIERLHTSHISPSNLLFLLSLISALILKYPGYLKQEEFISLLENIAELQSKNDTSKNDSLMGHICLCCISLLKTMRIGQYKFDPAVVDSLWDKIWGTTVRTIGWNQNANESHSLLQTLIVYDKAKNLPEITKFFIEKTFQVCLPTVETLNILLSKYDMSVVCHTGALSASGHKTLRNALIEWLLPEDIPDMNSVVCPSVTANVLLQLSSKAGIFFKFSDPTKGESSVLDIMLQKLDKDYITSSFVVGKLKNHEINPPNERVCLDIPTWKFIHELLVRSTTVMLSSLNSNVLNLTNLQNAFYQFSLLIEVWRVFHDYIPEEPLFVELMNCLMNFVVRNLKQELLTFRSGSPILWDAFEKFQALLLTKYPDPINKWFCNFSFVDLAKFITSFVLREHSTSHENDILGMNEFSNGRTINEDSFSSSLDECFYIEHHHFPHIRSDNLTEDRRLHLECLKFLGCTLTLGNGHISDLNEMAIDILNNIPLVDLSSFNGVSWIIQCLIDNEKMDSFVISSVLVQLKSLFTTWSNDSETTLVILRLLRGLVWHIHSNGAAKEKSNFLVILNGLLKYIGKNKFGVKVTVAFIKCLESIAKIDCSATWSRTEEGPIVGKMINFLGSSSHEVRLAAIASLRTLLSASAGFMEDSWFFSLFSKICEEIEDSFVVEGNLERRSVIDEVANRSASALHTFLAIIVGSPLLYKKALFGLLKFCKQKSLDIELFKRALSYFGSLNKIDSLAFVARNLPFLVREWLENNFSLQDLPVFLNETSMKTFYEKYETLIVPTLILRSDMTSLEEIGRLTNRDISDLFKVSFAQVMGEVLSGVQVQDPLAPKCQVFLVSVLGRNTVEALLTSKLPQVMVAVYKKVHDPTHFMKLTRMSMTLPPPDKGCVSFEKLEKCIEYLQTGSPAPETGLIQFLCENSPDHIQMILLDLTEDIYEAVFLQDKLISFYHFTVFVSALAAEMKENSSQVVSHTICSVIYTLIHLIRHADSEIILVEAACNFLKYFCEFCLPQNAGIVGKLLVFITDALVRTVKCGENLRNAALNLLKFLFVENCIHFPEAILQVDTLPSDSVFQEMQNVISDLKNKQCTPSLKEEISSFLHLHCLYGKQGVESLKHLYEQLSHQKEELKLMYKDILDSRGFSEDCKKSLLHRLICRLIELAAGDKFEVSIHAGYCLGELGPSDLGTLVLRPDTGLTVTDVADIVPLVAECLLDNNISVVKYSSQAMYSLLKYRECDQYAEKQPIMSCGILCSDLLYPFTIGRNFQTLTFEIDESLSVLEITDEQIWCPRKDMDHENWVINLTTTLLRYFSKGNNFLTELIPLCQVKASFTEQVLPLFVEKLTKVNSEYLKIITQCIMKFFANHVKLNNLETTDNSNKICLNKASVQCMLNLVHFLRIHDSLVVQKWNPIKLDLNYLNIAQAAQFCNAHFSSILYVDLWSDKWLRSENSDSMYGHSEAVIERICEKNPDEGCIAQKILWEAYLKICNTDAIYGCGSSLLLDPKKRMLHYELNGQWEKVILSHDVQLSSGYTESPRGLIHALQKAGFQHVLDVYLRSAPNVQCSDLQYECAWRLAKWDTQLSNPHECSDIFEQCHFMTLRALSVNDRIGLMDGIGLAHKCVSKSLVNISLESCKSIYKTLSQFRQIQEIMEFYPIILNKQNLETPLKNWSLKDEITFNKFDDIEPVFWQRIVMLNTSQDDTLKQKAAEIAINLAGLAREENHLQIASKCLGSLNVCQLPSRLNALLKIEEARLAWSSGDLALGKRIMRDWLHTFDEQHFRAQNPVMFAEALKLYGDWMVETKSENPQIVIDRYYLKALQILNRVGDTVSENVLDIYSALARFADGEYQNFSSYFKSRAYQVKKEWIEKTNQDVENLKSQGGKIKYDEQRAMEMRRKHSLIDKEEICTTRVQMDRYLADAVKYYLRCFEYGDRNNLDIFRVASLWLENMLHPSLKVVLDENLFKIPSYKLLPILPQMAPRLSDVKDDFTIKLNKLLAQCAEEHPHHTLPIILALANSYKDQDFTEGASTSKQRKAEPRVLGAQKLIHYLSNNSDLRNLLQKMNEVHLALISLAYLTPGNTKAVDHPIPEKEAIRKLKKVDEVLVPSLTIPVQKSCKYNNIIGIASYEPSFSLVGGINAPKKLTCLGTDGVKRLQLIKGKDDLRQDAVMQQVFTIMNTFLQKSKDTSKRKLLIRTYKVLPLSQRSGVIQWCENTVPILIYLSGGNRCSGAHKKYYPNDILANEARKKMQSVAQKSTDKKLEVYQNICATLHPVFRYFFLEHFTSPGTWFERRLAYIHSVATSSMIGYILGLGDRHLMNILIDKCTAEVIHIDFGIAFEMGKILPTPETVPFRLTRDIVDGMGVSGVKGVFQRSCEMTMSVLREHKTVLRTVLEVLLYDPLYAWSITPSKAFELQRKNVKISEDNDSVEVNRMAERALQRLEQKLVGTDVGAGVSVPTQVSRLIQEASDPSNLCRMFSGWESYI